MPEPGPILDPRTARTAAEFVDLLRRLKAHAGLTYRQLEQRAAEAGEMLPRSTAATMLGRSSLPRAELVTALVRACGGTAAEAATWVGISRSLAAEPAVGCRKRRC